MLGGVPLDVGDAAFSFDIFPRLRVARSCSIARDDEFPASANLIFDAVADRYLPTEDLVVLGETVRRPADQGQAQGVSASAPAAGLVLPR